MSTDAAPLFVTPGEPPVPVPDNGIHSATVRKWGTVSVVGFGMAEGEEMSEHTSSRPAVIVVTDGSIEVSAAGRTEVLGPGGVCAMAPGTVHALRAVRPSSMTLILGPAPAA